MVAVIGVDVVEEICPFEDPIGKEIKIVYRPMGFDFFGDDDQGSFVYSHKFTVVGILEERGSMMGSNKDDRIIIPFSTFDNFALYSSQMGIDTFNSMTKSVKIAAVGICAVSLLVAGIGIMNIMLVSVNERTREIGIRKALGARKRDILGQFVVEAVVLSEIGGVIGVMTGLILGLSIGKAVPALTAAVPVWAVFLGLGFCSLVGLFFGIYPASRAARLDPIVALHYE
jgi:putative ABC transport system permease protein